LFSLQGVCSVSRGRRWWMEMSGAAIFQVAPWSFNICWTNALEKF
jgi:hypothetical protein